MTTVTVVIPVYKADLNEQEKISLEQCCKVLKNYSLVLVCPKQLDTIEYENLFNIHSITFHKEFFEAIYFKDIPGYNRLLLSKHFYERFVTSNYILIYQLDAYVFRDELKIWCEKAYDYIGAPLVGLYEEKVYHSAMTLRVGNGGFSLRRVQAYLDFFNADKNVFNIKQIVKRISFWKKPYTRIFVLILMFFGWRNKPKSLALRWQYNEDDFWSGVLDNSQYKLNKPQPQEALAFAFERFPSNMYQLSPKLPFGCHAWEKYEYDEFWVEYIV